MCKNNHYSANLWYLALGSCLQITWIIIVGIIILIIVTNGSA